MMKNKITAIIVEDIKDYHHVIETFLSEVSPNVQIVGNAYSLKEAESLIKKLSPNLLFLDIQFEAEGQTAFDLLSKFSSQSEFRFQVIITTAHNEQKYYAEAFNFGALHFLTKPIDKQKLKEAVERVDQNYSFENQKQWTDQFIQFQQYHDLFHSEKSAKRIIIEGMHYTEVINSSDVVYLEASGRYTLIYLLHSGIKPVCSSQNLGEYEKKLNQNSDFFRIHRNTIVNINYIMRFSKKDYSIVLPLPFEKIYASKDRFKDFMKFMETRIGL